MVLHFGKTLDSSIIRVCYFLAQSHSLSDSKIAVSCKFLLSCSYFDSGGSFLLLQASYANVTIENSTFFNSTLNLFRVQQAKQVLITNTTFQNIRLYLLQLSFMEIYLKSPNGAGLFSIQDSVFRNFTTPLPVISLNRGNFEFSLLRVQMEDIYSSAAFYSENYQQQFGNKPFGICITSRGTGLTIKSSNFSNIHSSCLGLTDSKLSIISSLFDNSALNPGLALSENSYSDLDADDETSGVTWIKVEGISTSMLNGDKVILQENIFLSNRLLPLYGGVVLFFAFIKFRHLGTEFERTRASSSYSRVKPIYWELGRLWRSVLLERNCMEFKLEKQHFLQQLCFQWRCNLQNLFCYKYPYQQFFFDFFRFQNGNCYLFRFNRK